MKIVLSIDERQTLDGLNLGKIDEFRFGNEFCFFRLQTLNKLKQNICVAEKYEKSFSFVYPRLNNKQIQMVNSQLDYLNSLDRKITVAINDIGTFHYVAKNKLKNLDIVIGRQLISVPNRLVPPMPKIGGNIPFVNAIAERSLFSLTNIHYHDTLDFFKKQAISGFEFDYIPETIQRLNKIKKKGFRIIIHCGNTMVALSRNCPTARLNQLSVSGCGKPCLKNKYVLQHGITGDLFLSGNAILKTYDIQINEINHLNSSGYDVIIDESLIHQTNKEIIGL